jgi:hypothetical protein
MLVIRQRLLDVLCLHYYKRSTVRQPPGFVHTPLIVPAGFLLETAWQPFLWQSAIDHPLDFETICL